MIAAATEWMLAGVLSTGDGGGRINLSGDGSMAGFKWAVVWTLVIGTLIWAIHAFHRRGKFWADQKVLDAQRAAKKARKAARMEAAMRAARAPGIAVRRAAKEAQTRDGLGGGER